MKQATKKTSKTTGKLLDEKHMGQEPVHAGPAPMSREMWLRTLNWYNYMADPAESRTYIIAFLKAQKLNKSVLGKIRLAPTYAFPNYVGWVCRQMTLGSVLPEDDKKKALLKVKEYLDKGDDLADTVVTEPTLNVQARLKRKSDRIMADLEDMCDAFSENDESYEKEKHNFYEILVTKETNSQIASRIVGYYTPILQEIALAISGKDEQIKEAYQCYKKTRLKKIVEFYTALINDAKRISDNAKITRQPRKPKVKSAGDLVKKVIYQKEDVSYKLKSIDPINIIGSSLLWVFNTKTRTLSSYSSDHPKGMSVKGTTIQGFDEAVTVSKKLRKPEDILPKVLGNGKVALRKLMDGINSVPSRPSGRINSDTILLRAIK